MDVISLLQRFPLFARLAMEDVQEIAKKTKLHRYQKGHVIIEENSKDDRLFIVVEGKVQVIKGLGRRNEKILHVFGQFDYFGELALIDELERSASVVAMMTTEALTIDRWNLLETIRRNPELAIDMLKEMSWRLRATTNVILSTIGTLEAICIKCHRIYDRKNEWVPLGKYVEDYSESHIKHSLCPGCSKKRMPQFYRR